MKFDIEYLVQNCGFKPSQYVLIHVGANLCQESDYYDKFGFEEILWIEALPDVYNQASARLTKFSRQKVIQALVWKEEHVFLALSRASNGGESSSILEPKRHLDIHPWVNFKSTTETLETTTLDRVTSSYKGKRFFIVLDVQGAEFMVILGATKTLSQTDILFCEVSAIELYKDQALISQIVEKLKMHNLLIDQHDITWKSPFGDALFIRQERLAHAHPFSPTPFLYFYFKLVQLRNSKVLRRWDKFYIRVRGFCLKWKK